MTFVVYGKRIRIQWSTLRATASQQDLALALSALMAPCALVAFTLTCWSVAADLHWTATFFVTRGFFSHWQSWLIASILLLFVSRLLANWVGETDSKYRG